ncbi:hypothetical protein PSYMO_14376 [Pseudomonas amygdali pv. mori str. 301020]|uniref:Uncharacterized protein n=1 Tax=Pseudomonas amygdali pv. mori str. 301020 TaxID=629261 RepID=A0A656GBB0_PSEA0|nr:hypothetical protein PSYMO_14376 [Pseudomonas amygdali pv. mori str. 301020]
MMRHMARLLHHLDQQDRIALKVQVFQGRQVERQLITKDEVEMGGFGQWKKLRMASARI